jgi:hypothetical protein
MHASANIFLKSRPSRSAFCTDGGRTPLKITSTPTNVSSGGAQSSGETSETCAGTAGFGAAGDAAPKTSSNMRARVVLISDMPFLSARQSARALLKFRGAPKRVTDNSPQVSK